jgi:hydroxyacylglutathione hydrolase
MAAMLIETFVVGMLSTNCYVASCQKTKEAIIVDPGIDFSNEAQPIFEYIDQAQLKIKYIVNTHGHQDHVNGDGVMQQKYRVPICIHQLDAGLIAGFEKTDYPPKVLLKENDEIRFGEETLKVLHTPGHTPGSISLVGTRLVFTGDTLFAGGIGRTDFLGGSNSDMKLSLERLVRLPAYFMVYPGHGETTIMGEEKRVNPFLNGNAESLLF